MVERAAATRLRRFTLFRCRGDWPACLETAAIAPAGGVSRQEWRMFRKSLPGTRLAFALALISIGLGALVSLSLPANATSQSYTFTTLDFPNSSKTFGMGNNASGDIVGYYVDSTAPFHGFVLRAGKYSTLDFPGDNVAWTQANAVNDAGDITGLYSLKAPAPAGNVHGFLLTSDGKWSTVDYPEEGHTMSGGGYAIANDRTVFGCFHDGAPITAMFGYSVGPGGAARFEYPVAGAAFAMHYGATPDGKTMVGSYRAGGTGMDSWHGYMVSGGKTISFDVPGQLSANALGIRQSPDVAIVGTYKVLVDKIWNQHGFLAATHGSLDPATWDFTMVDVPGATQTIVRGINASGQLVGTFFDAGGVNHAFLAVPVTAPAPSAPAPPSSGNAGLAQEQPTSPALTAAVGLVLVVLGASALAALGSRRRHRAG